MLYGGVHAVLHPCRTLSSGPGLAQLPALGDEDLKGCASLAELRLGHNDLTTLPAALSSCSRLKILDLGSNRIADIQSTQVRHGFENRHE